jgi:hypothetical protein
MRYTMYPKAAPIPADPRKSGANANGLPRNSELLWRKKMVRPTPAATTPAMAPPMTYGAVEAVELSAGSLVGTGGLPTRDLWMPTGLGVCAWAGSVETPSEPRAAAVKTIDRIIE